MTLIPVEVAPRFRRAYKKKPIEMRAAVDRTVLQLRTDPRYPELHTHKVLGSPGVWEAYMDQANRLTFCWREDTIVLLNHCNHDILKRA
ncbi:MAG: hypothetical protein ACR2H2_04200 [Solirubrobacteraceae bacterium]